MDAPNILENVEVELARKKVKLRRMARWLSAKKIALKRKKKDIQRTRRLNKLLFAENTRMQEIVDDFLVAAEAENTDTDPETANTSTENAVVEVIQGMNDLNLQGDNIYITVSQVQPFCGSGSAASGDNN